MDSRSPRVQRRHWLAGTLLTAVSAVVMAAFSTLAYSAAAVDAPAREAVRANDPSNRFSPSAGVQVASSDESWRVGQ